jgi:signal transduction histidine kinase
LDEEIPVKHSQQTLEHELLELLASQVRHAPIPVVLSMGLIAYMAFDYVSPWIWGTWMVAVVALQAVRVVVFRRLPRVPYESAARQLRTAVLINTSNTLLHSLSLCVFPLFTPFQGAVQSILFVGMGVASIVTTVGYRPFTLAHVLLGLVPLYTLWVWRGIAGDGGTTALLMGALGLGYGATLIAVASRVFRMYRETFDSKQKLEEALSQAKAADQAKTRFLASASHDLRQPIHALSLFTATLGMRPLDQRSEQIVEKMESAVQALSYQMDALLDISKLDAGIVSVRNEPLYLLPFLQRLQEEFAATAQGKNISLATECPDEARANIDAALLERIVRNLLGNAISHNQDCAVRLQVQKQAEGWRLTVSDTGSGIPEQEQGRVFEEFYQLQNPERDRGKGLGLGLAIVRRLVSLLELNMEFESTQGGGTEFRLHLPGSQETPRAEGEPRPGGTSLRDLSILVVDDESAVREGMQELLEAMDCSVTAVSGTAEALAAAESTRPDLALVDFRLRDHDSGLLTIGRLRELYPGLPAIIISGDTAPDRLQEAKAAGVSLLSKPVQVAELREAMAAACQLED